MAAGQDRSMRMCGTKDQFKGHRPTLLDKTVLFLVFCSLGWENVYLQLIASFSILMVLMDIDEGGDGWVG